MNEPIIDDAITPSDEPIIDEGITSKDILDYKWKEYVLYIEHFRYYLEIILKTNIFFYVTTGGVVGYYLSTSKDNQGQVKYFFLLPILVGTALTAMFIYGASVWKKAYINAQPVKESIETKLNTKELPDTHLVFLYLWLSAVMFSIVGLSLARLPSYMGDTSKVYQPYSISLAVVGWILPGFAPMINRWLRRQRSLSNKKTLAGKIAKWEKLIRQKEFDATTCTEMKDFDELIPFLKVRTRLYIWLGTRPTLKKRPRLHIRLGTIITELLTEDINRTKAKFFKSAAQPSPPDQGQNGGTGGINQDSNELNSNRPPGITTRK